MVMKNEVRADVGHPVIYLIPGQGSDARVFSYLTLDDSFEIRYIKYAIPHDTLSMREYAQVLSEQINTSERFILIGVSLGGMLAVEMADFMEPEKVIIISSAKHRHELPWRYTFQRKVPVYRLLPDRLAKIGAQMLQPIVEPDRKNEKEVCKQMLADKEPAFLGRTIEMIINWDRHEAPDADIIHIHGDNDHTIPIRNVQYDYVVKNGSHMMILTQGGELSEIIKAFIR
jgi:pimeloyl-ACP methyl ester carboxylesterase